MVTALVLARVARGRVQEIAQALAALPAITEVYSVAGRYDIAAVVRVRSNEDLADLVTGRMQALDGLEETETLIAFRAFSRFDLEDVFGLGLGPGT